MEVNFFHLFVAGHEDVTATDPYSFAAMLPRNSHFFHLKAKPKHLLLKSPLLNDILGEVLDRKRIDICFLFDPFE